MSALTPEEESLVAVVGQVPGGNGAKLVAIIRRLAARVKLEIHAWPCSHAGCEIPATYKSMGAACLWCWLHCPGTCYVSAGAAERTVKAHAALNSPSGKEETARYRDCDEESEKLAARLWMSVDATMRQEVMGLWAERATLKRQLFDAQKEIERLRARTPPTATKKDGQE